MVMAKAPRATTSIIFRGRTVTTEVSLHPEQLKENEKPYYLESLILELTDYIVWT